MSDEAPAPPAEDRPWRTQYTALVCRSAEQGQIALLPADGAWALPQWESAARHWFKDTAAVNRGLRQHFGLDGIVLRYVQRREDEDARLVAAGCVVEPREPAWQLPGGWRWTGRRDLEALTLARPEQRPMIERCLDELAGGPLPPGRNAYAMPGWFGEASAWMEAKLRAAGRPPLGPIEQLKTWGISCVLRAETPAGDVYLKVPSRHFAQEAPITRLLAHWYPDRMPGVVAIDDERGWLLLDDVGPPLFRHPEPALWDRTIDLFGEMQRGCIGRARALLAAGAVDRRLGVLRAQIGTLAAAPEVQAEAAPEVTAQLAREVPRLQALCDELATYGIAETLVHGDLHGGNVGVRDGKVAFFDWTDACIAHPFLDLVTLLPEPGERDDLHERLRDRYLAGWESFASPERRRRAFDLAWCLGALHQAVSYVGIIRSLEPGARSEFLGATGSWLGRALDGAERLD